MAKINVLEKHVAELIAAGEVVERPASVIKELVENSVDAGATAVTVEIQNGGITFMRVTDNGCGIGRDDVCTAFLRHATSKVSTALDLDSIGSLGFRGEALASISAVSRVELLTRPMDEEVGTRFTMNGGEAESLEEAGCPVGTTIVVRDLFFNVPARMKFLKKDVGEGNAIAGIVDKIAMSHPEIAVRFIRDRKEILHTPGDNKLSSAVYGVYGRDFLNSLIPVEYRLDNFRLWGFVSKPSAARPNRAMQSFFINGRYVRSRTAFAALEEAFKGSLTQGKFPSCVLHIEMSFSFLDVNVHPAKLEVRFATEKPIFDLIYHGVKSALSAGDSPKVMTIPAPVYPPLVKAQQMSIGTPILPVQKELPVSPAPAPQTLYDSESARITPKRVETSIEALLNREVESDEASNKTEEDRPILINERKKESVPVLQIKEEEEQEDDFEPAPQDISLGIMGEAFSTYIVAQYGDSLMLIDKHAAHERLLYEELREKKPGSEAQALLAPVTVTLDMLSYDALLESLDELDKVGFQIEDFGGGTVIVRSTPLSLAGTDAEQAVIEIAGYLTENKNKLTTEHLDWLYHNVACRAAVKGGQKSSNGELAALAKRLHENPEIRYCPHGRPIYVLIEKKDIEKQFQRI